MLRVDPALATLVVVLFMLGVPCTADADPAQGQHARYTGPIIDMHIHAFDVGVQGPPPVGVCVGEAANIGFDASTPWAAALLERVKHPRCETPFWSPTTTDALRDGTIAELDRLDITAVVSGTPALVGEYRARAPERVIPALYFNVSAKTYSEDELERLFADGGFKVLGELIDQYDGIAVDDPKLEPIWRFAATHDIPVAVHMGVGPPGAPYVSPGFRARLFSPLALEEVLIRYPSLRVYLMHAAWPMQDELKAMLYTYPQLHVDTGSLQMALTRPEYHRFLENLVAAGFVDRIMYGTDQIVWPGLIAEGVRAINDAPFLTLAQKQAILHDNAARFLRIGE